MFPAAACQGRTACLKWCRGGQAILAAMGGRVKNLMRVGEKARHVFRIRLVHDATLGDQGIH
jgi:hypothetical protein